MKHAETLPRRISMELGVVAGRKVATNLATLKDEKIPIDPKVVEAAHEVASATTALAEPGGSEVSMRQLDRVADRGIASFERGLTATVNLYTGEKILALQDDERAQKEAAELLLAKAFPEGTGYLKKSYGTQYVKMQALIEGLSKPPLKAALKTLHLGSAVGRLGRVTELYAQRLGITQTQEQGDAVAKNLEAWHEAVGLLSVRVSALHDKNTPADERLRALLLGPYEEAAAEERAADAQKRRKQKLKKQKSQ